MRHLAILPGHALAGGPANIPSMHSCPCKAYRSACLGRRAMVALMGAGDAESAAILTPYNGQVRLIRRILKEHTGDLYAKVGGPSPLYMLWVMM